MAEKAASSSLCSFPDVPAHQSFPHKKKETVDFKSFYIHQYRTCCPFERQILPCTVTQCLTGMLLSLQASLPPLFPMTASPSPTNITVSICC